MVISTWEYPTNCGWVAQWPGGFGLAADARCLLEQSLDKVRSPDNLNAAIKAVFLIAADLSLSNRK